MPVPTFRSLHRALTAAMILIVSGTGSPWATAQQPGAPAPPVFRSVVRLVVQTVTVKDKNGQAVEGLTAADFTITEDGDRQDVAFAEFQRLEVPADLPDAAGPVAPMPTGTSAARGGSVRPTTETAIAVGPPGAIRYGNRRLLALFFDLASMDDQQAYRAFNGARKFVAMQMTASDSVAILVFEGAGVRVRRDFTDDRALLLGTLDALSSSSDDVGVGFVTGPEASAAFGQDDGEFQIFTTDRQLSALQNAVEILRPLAEQKALIYFTSGLQLGRVNNLAQLRATTNAALRANVAIYPVDSRGLAATSPLGDATRASSGGLAMFSGQSAGLVVASRERSEDLLFSLAKDTGGTARFDYNDLSLGITDAARALSSYYIIGYYSSHTARDGKFRRVKVGVNGERSADLSYRQGYYADTDFARSTAAERERQLEQALVLENPITEIAIATEVNYFQINRAEYFVPVAIKIPGNELLQASRSGATKLTIDFIGEVKDDSGHTVQNVRDKVEAKVSGEGAAELQRRAIFYQTGFTLLPGRYALKVLARNAETGHIGTHITAFEIPNLERETVRLPISSVVLSGQRVGLGDVLFSVKTAPSALSADPLILAGRERLIPSVTRVFSRSRDLDVFLHAYGRGGTTTDSVVVAVALYQGTQKVLETPVSVVPDGGSPGSRATPVLLSVPLGGLSAGRYDLQVTVARPSGNKVAFWRAPIALVP